LKDISKERGSGRGIRSLGGFSRCQTLHFLSVDELAHQISAIMISLVIYLVILRSDIAQTSSPPARPGPFKNGAADVIIGRKKHFYVFY